MSEPKRRFLERASLTGSPSTTVVAENTVVLGGMRGKGQFVVFGEVHGDGDLAGDLHLAVSAAWYGDVRAQRAIVAGRIEGALVVADKLEIGLTAVIRGRVSARSIAIAQGAVVEGELEITSDAPIVQFVEKRHDPSP